MKWETNQSEKKKKTFIFVTRSAFAVLVQQHVKTLKMNEV